MKILSKSFIKNDKFHILILLQIIFFNYFFYYFEIHNINIKNISYLVSIYVIFSFFNYKKKFKYFVLSTLIFLLSHTFFVSGFFLKNTLSIFLFVSILCLLYQNFHFFKKNIYIINGIFFHLSIITLLSLIGLIFLKERELFLSIGYLTNFNCGGLRINDFHFGFSENSHIGIVLPHLFYSVLKLRYSNFHLNFCKIFYLLSIVLFLSLTTIVSNVILIFLIIIFERNLFIRNKHFFSVLIVFLIYPMIMNNGCFNKLNDFGYKDNIYSENNFIENSKKPQNNSKFVNVSTFVYLNHIDLLNVALEKKPFGYGFNNYESLWQENYEFLIKKYKIAYGDFVKLNFNDGASNLIKILGEFGIFTLFFMLVYLYFLISPKFDKSLKILFSSILLVQLIRGAGYFNFNFIIYSSFLYMLVFDSFFKFCLPKD